MTYSASRISYSFVERQQVIEEDAWHNHTVSKRLHLATGVIVQCYCQPSRVATYRGSAMYIDKMHYIKAYHRKRQKVVVVKDDLAINGGMT